MTVEVDKIIFPGAGPFHLPDTQCGTAEGNPPNAVTMILYSLVDEREENLKAISTQMTAAAARELAIRLWLAAESDSQAKK